jgi:oligopeptide/dipeptide ABC transporter ATP-binding protein
MPETPLLSVQNLQISFRGEDALVPAVDGVSFSIYPRQTLAIVGESGCGKSVTAMSILRLIPTPPGKIIAGEIIFNGQDLLKLPEKAMRRVRGGQIAMIFQEPMTSLNPVMTIGDQILEAIFLHQRLPARQAVKLAAESLRQVGIADPERRLGEYPHQISGGMKQRVMIAMALACHPQILIADEPTTALDVTIQAQILELLSTLKTKNNMSVLLITHDLGVVAENADVVAIMYAGRIVEFADVYELYANPLHPYTRGLLACVPRLSQTNQRLTTIPGMVPNARNWPTGCRFEPRCTDCKDEARTQCLSHLPILRQINERHWVATFSAPGYADAKFTLPGLPVRRNKTPATGRMGATD